MAVHAFDVADGADRYYDLTGATLSFVDVSGNEFETVSIPNETRSSPVIDNGELIQPTVDGIIGAFE